MSEENRFDSISERHRMILAAIIDLFVRDAAPVGSRTLSKALGIALSPASIRNVMADLEDLGLLDQPHLSAGRVPTAAALRFWVERLVQPALPGPSARRALDEAVRSGGSPRENLERVASRLSDLCHAAGVAITPRLDQGRLARADLVPVGPDRVMLLWVTQRGVVYHRAIQLGRPVHVEIVAKLERLLNTDYRGVTFEELRSRIRQDLIAMKEQFDVLVERLLEVNGLSGDELIVEGVGRVVEQPDFDDIGRLRALYAAFEDRHALSSLLDEVARVGGLRVLINEDTGFHDLDRIGIVASAYGTSDSALGSVGVVGPSRMAYPEVLGLVKYAAQLLGHRFAGDGEDTGEDQR